MAASLTGSVYADHDGDGRQGAGEPGIAGVTVHLSGTGALGGPVARSTTTAPDGSFAFGGLSAGPTR